MGSTHNISDLIVLDFRIKALFSSYGAYRYVYHAKVSIEARPVHEIRGLIESAL